MATNTTTPITTTEATKAAGTPPETPQGKAAKSARRPRSRYSEGGAKAEPKGRYSND